VGPQAGEDPVAHYLEVLADKTGSLVATSARFGASFAGVDEPLVRALTAFGEEVGVAFQLSDDLLDIVSEDGASGKAPGTDLREGVATLPVLLALAGDDPRDARLRELVSAPVTDDDDHAEALELLRSSAALVRATEVLGDYAHRARERLAAVPSGEVRDALSALCDYVVTRTA
jgi:heptaprenyl diphosphate synthase